MSAVVLAWLAAQTAQFQAKNPKPDIPSAGDKAVLVQAARDCHVHPGSVYFVQYANPDLTVIHMTHAMGDTDEQLSCVLNHFPESWASKFGQDVEVKLKH